MGRGYELLGDLRERLLHDAMDGPVEPGGSLYEHVAERYGVTHDYARVMCNELTNQGIIVILRSGFEVVGYDLSPLVVKRGSPWTVTAMLASLVSAGASGGPLTRDRYDELVRNSPTRPPSGEIVFTFHRWERALEAAGLPGAAEAP